MNLVKEPYLFLNIQGDMPKSPEASHGPTSVDKVNAELTGFKSISPDETSSIVVEDLDKMNAEAAGVLKAEALFAKTAEGKGKARREKMGSGMTKFFTELRTQVSSMMKPIGDFFKRTKKTAGEVAVKAVKTAGEVAVKTVDNTLGAAEIGVEKVGAAATETARWGREDALDMEKSIAVKGAKVAAEATLDAAIAGGAVLGGAAILGAEAAVEGGKMVGRGVVAGAGLAVEGGKAVGRGAVKVGMFAGAVAAMPFIGAYKVGELAVKKGGEAAGAIKRETIAAMNSLDQAAQQVQGQISGAIAEGEAIYGAVVMTKREIMGGITQKFEANKQYAEDQQWMPYFEGMMALPQAERDAKYNAMSPQDKHRVDSAYYGRYQYMVGQQRQQVATAPQASQTQMGGGAN